MSINPPDVPRGSLRVAEFAQAQGLGYAKTYEYVMRGLIRSYKVGKRRLIPASEVLDFPARMIEQQDHSA
jgi:excisionase family DNA binding protein